MGPRSWRSPILGSCAWSATRPIQTVLGHGPLVDAAGGNGSVICTACTRPRSATSVTGARRNRSSCSWSHFRYAPSLNAGPRRTVSGRARKSPLDVSPNCTRIARSVASAAARSSAVAFRSTITMFFGAGCARLTTSVRPPFDGDKPATRVTRMVPVGVDSCAVAGMGMPHRRVAINRFLRRVCIFRPRLEVQLVQSPVKSHESRVTSPYVV